MSPLCFTKGTRGAFGLKNVVLLYMTQPMYSRKPVDSSYPPTIIAEASRSRLPGTVQPSPMATLLVFAAGRGATEEVWRS